MIMAEIRARQTEAARPARASRSSQARSRTSLKPPTPPPARSAAARHRPHGSADIAHNITGVADAAQLTSSGTKEAQNAANGWRGCPARCGASSPPSGFERPARTAPQDGAVHAAEPNPDMKPSQTPRGLCAGPQSSSPGAALSMSCRIAVRRLRLKAMIDACSMSRRRAAGRPACPQTSRPPSPPWLMPARDYAGHKSSCWRACGSSGRSRRRGTRGCWPRATSWMPPSPRLHVATASHRRPVNGLRSRHGSRPTDKVDGSRRGRHLAPPALTTRH
ncbi:hypothetical protein SAMN06264365_13360 [Actinoplanes regularis]|uniref:Uncharacterized protein n=1 Tax=Actinoplanes regularis TaxID=52697 RepID=A0A239J909_9ACTN|nr:hypothetical protein SAMN06264365_13360 [Actinoplanes regularis]